MGDRPPCVRVSLTLLSLLFAVASSEDDIPIPIPTWTKGPPSTTEEIGEYKAFMRVSAALTPNQKKRGFFFFPTLTDCPLKGKIRGGTEGECTLTSS